MFAGIGDEEDNKWNENVSKELRFSKQKSRKTPTANKMLMEDKSH